MGGMCVRPRVCVREGVEGAGFICRQTTREHLNMESPMTHFPETSSPDTGVG